MHLPVKGHEMPFEVSPTLGQKIGSIRQQERSLQSDAYNSQQEVAVIGIARSLVRELLPSVS